jgi:hypothetical protein
MTFKVTEHVMRQILDGATSPLIRDGKLIFHAIRLQQVRDEMSIEFINGSTTVARTTCEMPHFAAGQMLTVDGIEASMGLEFQV